MSTVKYLSDIPRGRQFVIKGFTDPDSDYSEKLLKMGFVEGTVVERTDTKINDPMIVSVRHSRVALRRLEAKSVIVRDFT